MTKIKISFIKRQKIKLFNKINLFTWEDFGKELASDPKNARDTWLIELTVALHRIAIPVQITNTKIWSITIGMSQ